MKFDRLLLAFREPIDAYDHALAALDLLLPAKCRLLDLVLHEALLDRDNGPTELVHALDQLPRSGLELIRQGLDEVRAAEGIGRVRGPGLVGEELLCTQGDARAAFGGQRERLVVTVRVKRLRAADDGGERLDRHANDVVLRLLRSERRAPGLRVEAKRLRLRVRDSEALLHDPRPHSSSRPKLRHLLEEVVVRIEEERQTLTELVG